jgi:hypothetical protein
MNARISLLRRFASALMGHAVAMLPSVRSAWGDAMEHELHHIEGDLEALTWAAGCVVASYIERSKVMDLIHTWYARVFLTLLIASQVLSMLFATALTVAYRLHYLGVAAFLGGFTPGDDYRRFIPLMDATPWWIHGLWVSASVLFLASGWKLLQNNRVAFPLFAAAWVLGVVGNLISQSMPIYREVFSFPAPMFTRDYLIPAATALLPVLVAAGVWAHGRVLLVK